MSERPDNTRPARTSPLRRLGRFIRNVLAVVGLFAIIHFYCFDLSKVVSGSMSPTLIGQGDANSDWVLIDKVSYRFRQPRRWEVVEFENSEQLDVAKRIVGLPGEKVAIQDHDVVINGNRLSPPPSLTWLKYLGCAKLYRGKEAECGTGYFVLGDDSKDSWDSRFEGPISPKTIRGRAWLRIWPLSRFGSLVP